MAPQTRSMAKSSPGRSTRNSVYGRSPLPPSSLQKGSITVHHAQAQDTECNASGGKGTPWLACRDAYGVMTTVAVSETGEGIHLRWHYQDEDIEVDEHEEATVQMIVDEPESRGGVTPVAHRPLFPHTPMPLYPFDAGSVIKTPVKKLRPLQASPPRIGDKGVRCLYENGGVLTDLNGGPVRIVLHHPVGTTANLSREQVELLQKEQEEKIARTQIAKLLEQKKRLMEEERAFSECGYEDESVDLSDGETSNAPVSLTHNQTPNGFRRRLGPEGTELID